MISQSLTAEERLFVEDIANFAGVDPKVVKDVYWAMLIATGLKLYEGHDSIQFPYLMKIHFDLELVQERGSAEKFVRDKYVVQAQPQLKDLFYQFATGKKLQLEKQFKVDMRAAIYGKLDLPKEAFRTEHA